MPFSASQVLILHDQHPYPGRTQVFNMRQIQCHMVVALPHQPLHIIRQMVGTGRIQPTRTTQQNLVSCRSSRTISNVVIGVKIVKWSLTAPQTPQKCAPNPHYCATDPRRCAPNGDWCAKIKTPTAIGENKIFPKVSCIGVMAPMEGV